MSRACAFRSALLALLLAGCASFDGGSLVPGTSREPEIVALMGTPAQRLELPNGDKALYFSRLPEGRETYVVTLGPEGAMKAIEQRLTRQNLAKLAVGVSTKKDVLALFGPPGRAGRLERTAREWWEYKYFDYSDRRIIWVQFSGDDLVREVIDMRDWEWEQPSGLFGMQL